MPPEDKTTGAPKNEESVLPTPPKEPDSSNVGDFITDILEEIEAAEPGLLEVLPPENKEKLRRVIETQVFARIHRGPLPSPEDIAVYDQHIPDGAHRIMGMAEKEQDSRIALQDYALREQLKQSGRGQIFGLSLGILGIASGSAVALLGSEWVGGIIAGTTVVSLVTAFLRGRREDKTSKKSS